MENYILIRRVKDEIDRRLEDWRSEHADTLGQLSYTDERRAEAAERERLTPLVAAEVKATIAARHAAIVERVRAYPQVRAYFDELAELTRLAAARDAKIAAIQAEFAAIVPTPWGHISEYNASRSEDLRAQIEAAGLEVCVRCKTAKNDLQLVLLDGQFIGSASDCMSYKEWFERRQTLERLCATCREDAAISPQNTSVLDQREPDVVYCFVRPTEERPDGVYAWFDDAWKPVPEETRRVEFRYDPMNLPERLCEQWNVPPELRVSVFDLRVVQRYDDTIVVPPPAP